MFIVHTTTQPDFVRRCWLSRDSFTCGWGAKPLWWWKEVYWPCSLSFHGGDSWGDIHGCWKCVNLIQNLTWSHHAGFVSLVPKEKNRLDSTMVVVSTSVKSWLSSQITSLNYLISCVAVQRKINQRTLIKLPDRWELSLLPFLLSCLHSMNKDFLLINFIKEISSFMWEVPSLGPKENCVTFSMLVQSWCV